ncbi:MAG: hypothetical protein DCC75_05990 [Proteobacteria bacterium]|nr:MAG: hypothetical protein DCC75_05990 [Pseudomonadota bacterium]
MRNIDESSDERLFIVSGSKAVVGVFSYLDDALKAVKEGQAAKSDYRVYSPVPNHELEDATFPQKSPVRLVTATGALTGLVCGFALAIWCSLDWPLRVSAKDIVSVPGFVVIGYECTILFGAIFTLLALFHFCKIPDILRKIGYDPRFSRDKFGVVIACDPSDVKEVQAKLKSSGADEVEVRDAL